MNHFKVNCFHFILLSMSIIGKCEIHHICTGKDSILLRILQLIQYLVNLRKYSEIKFWTAKHYRTKLRSTKNDIDWKIYKIEFRWFNGCAEHNNKTTVYSELEHNFVIFFFFWVLCCVRQQLPTQCMDGYKEKTIHKTDIEQHFQRVVLNNS